MVDVESDIRWYFTTFTYQDAAFHAQLSDPQARIFSYETPELSQGSLGRRHFICARPIKFFRYYKRCRAGRWFYELIQDGYPCRPYFDLEFYKKFNLTLDPMTCFRDFIEICKETFRESLGIELNESDFLALDSTTDVKFSSHLIVHLPDKQLFPSNIALKPLIDIICEKMLKYNKCIVKIDGGKDDFLCDRAVYSKNRNFRLYYSSKCGKKSKLLYASYSTFYETKQSSETIFFDSLVVPDKLEEYKILNVENLITASKFYDYQKSSRSALFNPPLINQYRVSDFRTLASGIGPSPFAEIDEFCMSFMRPVCPKIEIRMWMLIYDEVTEKRQIKYFFNNCRYCYNILREHKSQNVYWVVEIDYFHGMAAFQRCFDVDCRFFKSMPHILPNKIRENIKERVDLVFGEYGVFRNK